MTADRVEEQVIGNNGGNSGILGTTVDPVTSAMNVTETDPARFGQVPESLGSDNLAIGDHYLPSAAGVSNLGFKSLSASGELTTDGTVSTLTLEVRNMETGTWIPVASGLELSSNSVKSSITDADGPFAWDFDSLNKGFFRFKLVIDHATNTNEVDIHRTPI